MLPCMLALVKGKVLSTWKLFGPLSGKAKVGSSLTWAAVVTGKGNWLPERSLKAVIEKLAQDRRLRWSGLELAVYAPVPCVIDTMSILKESYVFLPPCGGSWEHERAF